MLSVMLQDDLAEIINQLRTIGAKSSSVEAKSAVEKPSAALPEDEVGTA